MHDEGMWRIAYIRKAFQHWSSCCAKNTECCKQELGFIFASVVEQSCFNQDQKQVQFGNREILQRLVD
jgi:hypothetical protein